LGQGRIHWEGGYLVIFLIPGKMKNVNPPPLSESFRYTPLVWDKSKEGWGRGAWFIDSRFLSFFNPVFSKIFKYQGVYPMNWKVER